MMASTKCSDNIGLVEGGFNHLYLTETNTVSLFNLKNKLNFPIKKEADLAHADTNIQQLKEVTCKKLASIESTDHASVFNPTPKPSIRLNDYCYRRKITLKSSLVI